MRAGQKTTGVGSFSKELETNNKVWGESRRKATQSTAEVEDYSTHPMSSWDEEG